MNLTTSTAVNILQGVGELEFPQALKRDLLMSSIYCQSLYLSGDPSATNDGLLLVCNGSYYITQNGTAKQNVLALFHNQAKSLIIHFTDHKFTINMPQYRLTIEIVNHLGTRQDISALTVLNIAGCVSNTLLLI